MKYRWGSMKEADFELWYARDYDLEMAATEYYEAEQQEQKNARNIPNLNVDFGYSGRRSVGRGGSA